MSDDGLVLVDGANQLGGIRSIVWVLRHWPALRRELVRSPGYVHRHVWFRAPFTIGLMTWWESEAAAYRFAYSPEHLRFWRWGAESGTTDGGWLAIYRYAEGGPLWGTGVQERMRVFARFVPPPSGEPPSRPPEGDFPAA
jgi:hypothetical protein